MRLKDPLLIAYRSFASARLRFVLTAVGVIIGVASVILVMGIGASAQRLVLSQVENAGSNLVAVLPGASEEDGPPASAFGIVTTTLTVEDLKALREKSNVPDATAFAGYVSGSATVESSYETLESTFQGVSPQVIEIENISLASGRFFLEEEENDLSRVVVLGADKAEELFPGREAVGETLRIKENTFKVVGVLEKRGSGAFSNPDTAVYVPLVTAQKLLLGIDHLNFVRGKVGKTEMIPRAMEDMERLLRDRHSIDEGEESDFSIRSTAAALDVLGNITNVLKYFLGAIASVSLLVGGIGIMNSMLIAVSQRIREIGLRKALGAKREHVLWQFLTESAVITLAGGIIGIIIGILLTWVAALVIVELGYEWEFLVPVSSVLLGLVVSLVIGIGFGLYPALKASKVSPMEALRYE